MEPNALLNMMVLGKKRVGKSSTLNTILGREAFTSKKSLKSVTQDVAFESGTVCGFQVSVYDTPGFCHPELSDEEIELKIDDVLQRCETHVFLLVIKADSFTEEERKTVEKIEQLLGEKRLKKTWIIFTRGDELEEENKTLNEFLEENKGLKNLVEKYDQRYCVFNNKKRGASDQARLLLGKILFLELNNGERMLSRIPVNRPNTSEEPDTLADSPSSTRIVLLGKTGVGKSASGNIILGDKVFKSEQSTSSVTHDCSDAHNTVSDRSVSVVDTPGFFDTHLNHKQLVTEIGRSVYISCPGPHAFLIVFPVIMRFTDQEQQIPQMIEMMFGEEVLKYSIILFTHGDMLVKSIEELIEENCALRHIVQQCGGRFHIFNKKDEDNREQVNDLLKKIDSMIEQNGGGHYSNQMFEDAQRFRLEEEEHTKQQEEKQRKEETESVREIEKIRAELEAEKKKQQKEKQRQEELERKLNEKENELEAHKKMVRQSTNIGFEKFYTKYLSNLNVSAFAVGKNNHMGEFIGGGIGGVVGAIAGCGRGLSGVITGFTAGAGVGVTIARYYTK